MTGLVRSTLRTGRSVPAIPIKKVPTMTAAYLIFLAGFELDLARIRGRSLQLRRPRMGHVPG